MATVGERLKEERLLRGWSQRDLAREAGTTAETISSIETGQHEARPSTLRKLAKALGMEVRDLFMEPVLPKAPARKAGQPDEITAAVSQVAEQATAAAEVVAEQAAAGGRPDDEVSIINLESRDDIERYISEIVWNLPAAANRRLVVNIYADDSAEIHVMPVRSTTERSARKKRAEK